MFEFFKTMENFENAINNPNVVIQNNPETCVSPEEPNYLDLRNKARADKNYKEADNIRNYLLDKGVLIEDKDGKTIWKFK